ncbi:hypothetical protein EI94DRAFT_1756727 [Lactarius quietus]|nr:hypothetical protein EI94DRAFT_1756727 [Lactarius quietus]
MEYVQRVKMHFSNDPDTYKQFMDILYNCKSRAHNARSTPTSRCPLPILGTKTRCHRPRLLQMLKRALKMLRNCSPRFWTSCTISCLLIA